MGTKARRAVRIGSLCVTALVLTGCSLFSQRPTVEEVAVALESDVMVTATQGTPEYRECAAQVFVDSDMSDEWLARFVGITDQPYQPTEEETQVAQDTVLAAERECLGL